MRGKQLSKNHTLQFNSGDPSGQSGVLFQLEAGPYQNNGATPWYALIPVGSSQQILKVALDTGCNFIWMTSTLCGPTGCQHYGGTQFDPTLSTTFSWIDQQPFEESFGPWGNMTVEVGQDSLVLPTGDMLSTPFYMATAYEGQQFEALDWDGGIGLPSGSIYAAENIPPAFATMIDIGLIDPQLPYMSFNTDQSTNTGQVLLGGFDASAFDPYSGVFMRWTPYTAIAGVEYIWTTPLANISVGENTVAANVLFALDSGSSQFKGDNTIMNTILNLLKNPSSNADVTLLLGEHQDGTPGFLTIPPAIYNVEIEAGPDQGQVLPQFNPLSLTDLVLVGSVLMDHVYSIYEYNVTLENGQYNLLPVGMWLFNKVGGPQIITSTSKEPVVLGRKVVQEKNTFNGTWVNDYGSQLTLTSNGEALFGTYSSTTGASGEYYVLGFGSTKCATSEMGAGISLSILWRSFTGGSPDASWHWVSGLSGQAIMDNDNNVSIILNHNLVATSPLKDLAGIGAYTDKLIFKPKTTSNREARLPEIKRTASSYPIESRWWCEMQQLGLSLRVLDDKTGWVEGELTLGNENYFLQGFTDTYAAGVTSLQGLTLSAAIGDQQYVVFSGTLDVNSDVLSLLEQISNGTSWGDRYVQTAVQGLYFKRQSN